MTEIGDFRRQIEEFQKRRGQSADHGGDQLKQLDKLLDAVKTSLLCKHEIIENQKKEIKSLRDENTQLSDMLRQALLAVDECSNSSVRKIVQDLDAAISDLLEHSELDGVTSEENGIETKTAIETNQAEPDSGTDRARPPSGEKRQRMDLENDSPALKRIMERKRR